MDKGHNLVLQTQEDELFGELANFKVKKAEIQRFQREARELELRKSLYLNSFKILAKRYFGVSEEYIILEKTTSEKINLVARCVLAVVKSRLRWKKPVYASLTAVSAVLPTFLLSLLPPALNDPFAKPAVLFAVACFSLMIVLTIIANLYDNKTPSQSSFLNELSFVRQWEWYQKNFGDLKLEDFKKEN